jgi:cytoskeletal protein CcmA (bactofilin family)
MLDSGKRRAPSDGKTLTIIGQGTTFNGEIKSQVTIRVEGRVQGRVQSEDTIIVQETGRVKAELMASQIVISGEVEGNVFAQERLEITSNGKLIGDITAPKVSIAEGVVFEGKCSMKPPAQARPQQQSGDKNLPAQQPGQRQETAPAPQPSAEVPQKAEDKSE